MFPYSLGQQLINKQEQKSDNNHSSHSDDENNNNRQNKSNWFHSYQIPAEKPKPSKPVIIKNSERKRSKSMDDIPIYEPMNPEKKMDWNKLIPHPKQNWFHCYQVPAEKPKES